MKMRNIYKLVEAMKKVIPENEIDFQRALNGLLDSANYRAPEAYFVNFEQLAQILASHLGDPENLTEDWQHKVVSLFSDETKVEGMDYVEL